MYQQNFSRSSDQALVSDLPERSVHDESRRIRQARGDQLRHQSRRNGIHEGRFFRNIFISNLAIFEMIDLNVRKNTEVSFLDFFIRIYFPGNNRKIRRRQIRGAVVIDDEDARLPCGRNEQFQLVVQ